MISEDIDIVRAALSRGGATAAAHEAMDRIEQNIKGADAARYISSRAASFAAWQAAEQGDRIGSIDDYEDWWDQWVVGQR